MGDYDSDEDLVVIYLLYAEEERIMKQKGKKTKWIADIPKSRYKEGEYHYLFPRLLNDSARFHAYFRMSKTKFYELLHWVEPHITHQDTRLRKSIGAEERLMVTIRFLATGDSFKTIGESFRLGYSTVQEITHTTCAVIWEVLSKLVMPEPNEEMWKKIGENFKNKWNFPNCLGALDGKHIKIQAPDKSGSLYYNYKKYFSIILMALVDADYKFIVICVGDLGKNSDGGIFSRSELGKRLECNNLNVPSPKPLSVTTDNPVPYVIAGDEAFPLKPYLMRPYPGNQLDDESKKIYNYRHSRARRVSENAFGILCQKFRIYYRTISLCPKNVDNIVLATCCLHNFLRNDSVTFINEQQPIQENISSEVVWENLPRVGGNFTNNAFEVREKFKEYFTSNEGSLPWQRDRIRRGCRREEELAEMHCHY